MSLVWRKNYQKPNRDIISDEVIKTGQTLICHWALELTCILLSLVEYSLHVKQAKLMHSFVPVAYILTGLLSACSIDYRESRVRVSTYAMGFPFLSSVLSIFASGTSKLCNVQKHLGWLFPLDKLTTLSFQNDILHLWQYSLILNLSCLTLILPCQLSQDRRQHGLSFFHPFTFSLLLFLQKKFVFVGNIQILLSEKRNLTKLLSVQNIYI